MSTILKNFGRQFIYPLVVKTGILTILNSFIQRNYLVLNYHGVIPEPEFSISKNHISTHQFEQHIAYFKAHYNLLSPHDFFDGLKNKRKGSRKSILITFDDGYENNFDFAYPVLKKYDAPAIIFPITGLIDTDNPSWYDLIDLTRDQISGRTAWQKAEELCKQYGYLGNPEFNHGLMKNFIKTLEPAIKTNFLQEYKRFFISDMSVVETKKSYWKMMSSVQIKKLNESGLIHFGSHTVNHPNLDLVSESTVLTELTNSKQHLESLLNQQIKSIAFPDGAYNDKVKDIARSCGYSTLFSVNPKCNSDLDDPTIFQRLSISNSTTTEAIIINTAMAFLQKGLL